MIAFVLAAISKGMPCPNRSACLAASLQTSLSNILALLLAAVPHIVNFLLLIGIGRLIAGAAGTVVTHVKAMPRMSRPIEV
jgi:hypothetical protein